VADLRRPSLRMAVGLAIVILAVVNAQALMQTMRSQTRLRERMIRVTRDTVIASRPRLAQLLRSGGGPAWADGAREALTSAVASEFEIFDFSGQRLFSSPGEVPVVHWPAPQELETIRNGAVVTAGPVAGQPPRLLHYASFDSGDSLLLFRATVLAPELTEDLHERRELLVGHAIVFAILIIVSGLALFPRREESSPPPHALDAYEEAMARLRERGDVVDREHAEERQRMERRIEDSEALARAGELTAGIAHEVRNGLGTIVGYARLLERNAVSAETQEAAIRIREECETLETVVRRFMDFVKTEKLSLGPFDVGRMLSRVASRESRSRPGAEMSLAAPAHLGTIVGDEEMLERAFENLVRNAREAAGQNGHVWVEGTRDGGAVSITIADDGPGLAVAARQDIRPFASTKAGGLGLGLPIAVKIVRLHNGDLALADRPPRGLAVTVRLPSEGPGA
jgi:signal transduction histidine kinase